MTITLSQQTENRLREVARQQGGDINTIAEALLTAALEWEAQERLEAIAGVRRGEQAANEGRERSLTEFITEQRAKHGFASSWPQDASEAQRLDDAA